MADKQANLNIPQEFNTASLNDTAKDLLNKSNFYRQYFGDDFISNGFQQMGPKFFSILDAEVSRNPDILANISATSGMYKPDIYNPQSTMPGMVNARLGTEAGNFRAGVSVPFVQGMDQTYRRMPTTYDVGYNTGLFGGNLDVTGGITPKEGMMPQSMYNIMARYTKQF
jgi:hypothetical protein